MELEDKPSKGVSILRRQGHTVEARFQFGKTWWEIDRRMLATREEVKHIADGIYSLPELEELYLRRHRDEQSG
jgi:hypothetical protein